MVQRKYQHVLIVGSFFLCGISSRELLAQAVGNYLCSPELWVFALARAVGICARPSCGYLYMGLLLLLTRNQAGG